jgi:hypothetical protein
MGHEVRPAHSLAGADGGDVEYDRALVDLTSAVLAMDRAAVAERIPAPRHRS